MNIKKIRRAIISVADKSNLKSILSILKKFKIKIISSGGSFKKIKKMNYECTEVSNYTGFSEILDGRIKTLHPKIHAGILGIRNNRKHKKDLKKNNIKNIDLVICDLYPFEKQIKKKVRSNKLIEYIDIGGSALLRAAAKNFNDVAVISSLDDYPQLIKELNTYKGGTSFNFRKLMSAKAFGLTSYYDSTISTWFNSELNIKFPEKITVYGKLKEKLRYGENPHQQGNLYSPSDTSDLKKIYGKDLSYNNYNDIHSTLLILESLNKNNSAVIVKHANPCGVSSENDQLKSFNNALKCDPVSAFGGVVGINSIISEKLALELSKTFFEIIISKGFKKNVIKILKKRKNIKLIDYSKFNLKNNNNYLFLNNSFLVQDSNSILIKDKLKVVTRKKPSISQINSLKLAFNICKFVKSNAIVIVNDKSTIGIGSGQPSRLDSCKIAIDKAQKFLYEKVSNSVAASDAFFPFPDGVHELVDAGVTAIIQPGGSKNDSKIIKAANDAGIVMAFTKTRHFRH